MKPDWMLTRVIVVSIAILAPIYFFILVSILPFQIAPFSDIVLNLIFHYFVVPAVFSTAWVGLIYFKRYRLANTVFLMQETTTSVPLRWRVFYGFNAAFVLTFFVLPLAAAPLAIVTGLLVAGHVFYTIGVGKLGAGKLATSLAIIVAIILCILPSYIMIKFIPGYLAVWEAVLNAWAGLGFNVVYGISQCLVNALSIGAPIHFIYYAAQEYDKGVYGEVYTTPPKNGIRLLQLTIFLVFTYLYLPPISTPLGTLMFADQAWLFTSYINWISLAIVGIMVLVKMLLKVENDTTIGGASNIVVVGLFLMVEIFFKTELVETLIVWLAFLVFAGIILANYLRASPREMY